MVTMLRRAVGLITLTLAGAVVATVGSGGYRSLGYLGVVLALVLVAAGGLFAKTWHGWAGFGGYATAWVLATYFLAQRGPGGSVLIPANDLKASLWVYGGAVVMSLVAAIPPYVLVGRDVAS